MSDIFISYSRHDSDVVNEFVTLLEQEGCSIWIDRDGIESGDAFKKVILRAIKESSIVLFFSSEFSNQSEWTAKEIGVAVKYKKHIIPIMLDSASFNEEVEFDLINLDYIDYSDASKRVQMKEKLVKSLKKKLGKEGEENKQLEESIAHEKKGKEAKPEKQVKKSGTKTKASSSKDASVTPDPSSKTEQEKEAKLEKPIKKPSAKSKTTPSKASTVTAESQSSIEEKGETRQETQSKKAGNKTKAIPKDPVVTVASSPKIEIVVMDGNRYQSDSLSFFYELNCDSKCDVEFRHSIKSSDFEYTLPPKTTHMKLMKKGSISCSESICRAKDMGIQNSGTYTFDGNLSIYNLETKNLLVSRDYTFTIEYYHKRVLSDKIEVIRFRKRLKKT